jgi:hypothetical protein
MAAAHRLLGLGSVCAALLCGCGSSSFSSESGSTSAAVSTAAGASSSNPGGFTSDASSVDGTHDSIVATPPSNLVSVEVGTKQTVSITFTSSDGRTITGFGLSSGSGVTLPAGWSGPATFGCASLSTGSSCVLNLTFTPTMYEIGRSLTLNYVYVDNSTEPVINGSMTLAYQATTSDNVLAMLAPIGQVNATVNSGSQIVTATFTTNDGNPASAFTVTSDPTALPSGWTAPATSSCATVSAGTACQLAWVYMPTAPGNGTITIDYAFNDDSGTPKTASFNIPYAATANDNVVGVVSVGAVSPVSSISVAGGSSKVVTVTFTTDDTFEATNLSMDLSTLPGDWFAASNPFTCAAISTGTACQLNLTYSPAVGAGDGSMLQLTYGYLDNAGMPKNGSVNIAYTST